jgi:homoserine dehydrogenase
MGYKIKLMGVFTAYRAWKLEQRMSPCLVPNHITVGPKARKAAVVVPEGDAVGQVVAGPVLAKTQPQNAIMGDVMDIARARVPS